MRIFERSAGIDAVKYAEAQALIDDGFSLAEVLTMFREDKEWLAPLLTTTAGIRTTYVAEEPSYYFEASLKNRFLEASRRRAEPSTTLQRFRTTAAGAAVLVATGAVAVVTLGFVTANNAVPGDWNYSFKLAHERMEYALASGNDRVDVQLHQAEARVYEIQQRSAQGQVSANDINKLQRETATLKDEINRNPDLDDVQRTRLRVLAETVPVVLNNVTNRNAELAPAAEEALNVVNGAVAAGFGGTSPVIVTAIATPSPTAATALTSTTTATPVVFTTAVTPTEGTTGTVVATEPTTPTPSGTVEPTKTPEPTVSTTPEPSETPTETVTPTPTPAPSTTVTPSTTPEPSRTTEPQVGGTPTPPASTTPPVSSTPTPPTEH